MVSLDILKSAYSVLKEANRLDLAAQITDLRQEMLNLKEDNLNLKEENSKLKEQLELNSKIIFKNGICWLLEDNMKEDNSPTIICPHCWQVDKIVNRIEPYEATDGKYIDCSTCKNVFGVI